MFTRPVSAVPAQRSSTALLKVKLYAIIGAAGLAAATGLFAALAWVAFTPDVPDVDDLLPRGTAVAEVVARDYLAGRETAVPTAVDTDPTFGLTTFGKVEAGVRRGLPVSSLTPLRFDRQTLATDDGAQTYEIHSYLVATGQRLLELDVTVLLTPEGPVLAAQPSLAPYTAPVEQYLPLDYRQLTGGSGAPAASDDVTKQVARWANAFARNDAAELRTVAGDQVTGGSYVGLGGFRIADAPRLVTTVPGSGDDVLVLRVQLLLADASAQEIQVSADYDLLIHDAATSLPKVVAWGPAGTPVLEPYMNNPTSSAPADTP